MLEGWLKVDVVVVVVVVGNPVAVDVTLIALEPPRAVPWFG